MGANSIQDIIWSLGCDVTIEDIDATIQEIKVKDITLSGVVSQEELSVNIDHDKVNVMDVDVNVVIDGISSSLVESQIVPYDTIKQITEFSPEYLHENGFASSARAAKKNYDLISEVVRRVDIIENSIENGDFPSGGDSTKFWRIEDGKLVTDYDIFGMGNIFAKNEISAGGVGNEGDVEKPESGGSGEGGSATLEQDIIADVAVGNIKKGATLSAGMTLTDIFVRMLSQSIINVLPSVRISSTPSQCEVGTTVSVNPTHTFVDGRYNNTPSGDVNAGCNSTSFKYYLDEVEITTPYTLVTRDTKKHTVSVSVSYSDATAVVNTASGEPYTDTIKAGTARASASFDVCYRWFWGFADKGVEINSALVRKLKYTGFIPPLSKSETILSGTETTLGGKDIIIAMPKEYVLSNVMDGQLGSSYVKNFTNINESGIEIKCIGDASHLYNVYLWKKGGSSDGSIKNIVIKLR